MSPKDAQTAWSIAHTTLRNQSREGGVLAGASHFSDIWIRDCMYASLGLLVAGETTQVKKNLIACLDACSEIGQIPLRIGIKNVVLRFLGDKKSYSDAVYVEDKHKNIVVDSNALFLWVFHEYIHKTSDLAFLEANWGKLKKIADWYEAHVDEGGLIYEQAFAGWADSVAKRGNVLYTNILYWIALDRMMKLSEMYGDTTAKSFYQKRSETLHQSIQKSFWNEEYFIDFVDGEYRHEYLATDGNLLAIYGGFVDIPTGQRILEAMKEHGILDLQNGTRTIEVHYKKKYTYAPFRWIGLGGYHGAQIRWTWLTCLHALSCSVLGMKEDAYDLWELATSQILKNNQTVYEILLCGKPFRNLFYRSEKGFSWSASIYLLASNSINEANSL